MIISSYHYPLEIIAPRDFYPIIIFWLCNKITSYFSAYVCMYQSHHVFLWSALLYLCLISFTLHLCDIFPAVDVPPARCSLLCIFTGSDILILDEILPSAF